MFATFVSRVKQAITTSVQALRKQVAASTKPMPPSLWRGGLRDLVRSQGSVKVANLGCLAAVERSS